MLKTSQEIRTYTYGIFFTIPRKKKWNSKLISKIFFLIIKKIFLLIRCFCSLISAEYHPHYLLLLTFFFFFSLYELTIPERKKVSSSLINHWKTHKQDSFLRRICIISERQETQSFYVFVLKFSPRCSFLIPSFYYYSSLFLSTTPFPLTIAMLLFLSQGGGPHVSGWYIALFKVIDEEGEYGGGVAKH